MQTLKSAFHPVKGVIVKKARKAISYQLIAEAGRLTAEASKAITDIRSNAEYRDEMAGLLLTRGLKEILKSSI